MTNFSLIYGIIYALMYISPFQVEGDSMLPIMPSGEYFLINSQNKIKNNLQRGDIVVFQAEDGLTYVKRVIGLPQEIVKTADRNIQIKTQNSDYFLLRETYLLGNNFDYGDERIFIVPENQYFVLGDNRANSKDSRYFSYPYISQQSIIGKMIYEFK